MYALILEAVSADGKPFVVNDTRDHKQKIPQLLAREDARRPFILVFPTEEHISKAVPILASKLSDPDPRIRESLIVNDPSLPRKRHSLTPHTLPCLHDPIYIPYHALYSLPTARKWITQSDLATRHQALEAAKAWLLENKHLLPEFPLHPSSTLTVLTPEDHHLIRTSGLALHASAWGQLQRAEDDHQSFLEYVLHDTKLVLFYGYEEDLSAAMDLPPALIQTYAASQDLYQIAQAIRKHYPRTDSQRIESLSRVKLKSFSYKSLYGKVPSRESVRAILSDAHRWCALNRLRPSHKARTSVIRALFDTIKDDKPRHRAYPGPQRHVPCEANIRLPNKDTGKVKLLATTKDHEFASDLLMVDDFLSFLSDVRTIPEDFAFRLIQTFDGQAFYHQRDPYHKRLREKLTKIQEYQLIEERR